jgi:hypothetical protein
MRFIAILLLVKLVFVAATVSGAPLTTLNYEGVACAEKCSCRRDFFDFSSGNNHVGAEFIRHVMIA